MQFGLGSELFGDSSGVPSPHSEDPADDSNTNDEYEDDDASSTSSIVVALASTTLSDSQWITSPAYSPIYLSTTSEEYLEPEVEGTDNLSAITLDDSQDNRDGWASEKYENSLEIDHVFDGFSRRVAAEAHQCVRLVSRLFQWYRPAFGLKSHVSLTSDMILAALPFLSVTMTRTSAFSPFRTKGRLLPL
jgi:hypothetical protein